MIDLGLGICHPWQNDEQFHGPSWADVQRHFPDMLWYNYKWDHVGALNYVPMLWGPATTTVEGEVLRRSRGGIWLWGNEPEDPRQGFMEPDQAAISWGTWREMTRPLGILSIAPNVQFTNPLGALWLAEFARLVEDDPPDAWGVHTYWSRDVLEWRDSWELVREWARAHGGGSPVAITEVNAYAWPSPGVVQVQREIARTVREDPFLCGAFWFATSYPDWEYSNLLTSSGDQTPLGASWATFQAYANGTGDQTVFLPFLKKT